MVTEVVAGLDAFGATLALGRINKDAEFSGCLLSFRRNLVELIGLCELQ